MLRDSDTGLELAGVYMTSCRARTGRSRNGGLAIRAIGGRASIATRAGGISALVACYAFISPDDSSVVMDANDVARSSERIAVELPLSGYQADCLIGFFLGKHYFYIKPFEDAQAVLTVPSGSPLIE